MNSLEDFERQFLQTFVEGGEMKSLSDLRMAFYSGVIDGSIVIGGGGGPAEPNVYSSYDEMIASNAPTGTIGFLLSQNTAVLKRSDQPYSWVDMQVWVPVSEDPL